jgi:CheY-like chemotaxis protein
MGVPSATNLRPGAVVRTILVVEDDDAVRGVVAEWLATAGYSVFAVATSYDALREFDTSRPIDLAVIDIKMPPGNPHGFALARMARLRRPGLRLVFMSGYPEVVEADGPPPGSVLLKPVRLDKLREVVNAELLRDTA